MRRLCKNKDNKYTERQMKKALLEVRSGCPINEASRKYKIPRSTLHSRVINKYEGRTNRGVKSALTDEEEKKLVEWIKYMCTLGHPIRSDCLINSVEIIVRKNNRPNAFVNNRPSKKWCDAFINKYSGLKRNIRQTCRFRRVKVTKDDIIKWFARTEEYLKKIKLENIESTRVFSIGDILLTLAKSEDSSSEDDLRKETVDFIGEVYDTNQFRVLIAANSAKQLAPAMIIPDFLPIHDNDMKSKFPNDWSIGRSNEGTVDGYLLYQYIESNFYPWLIKCKIQLPVILFLNGYAPHLTQPLKEFCKKNKIILVILPAETTDFMHPLNSFFRTLEQRWICNVDNYVSKTGLSSIRKSDLGPELNKIFKGMNLIHIVTNNGFKRCGLHPLSADAVDYSTLDYQSRKINKVALNSNSLLEAIESLIDQKSLKTFKSAIDDKEWTGNIEDQNLFYLWKKISDIDHKQKMDFNPILTSDDDDETMSIASCSSASSGTTDDSVIPYDSSTESSDAIEDQENESCSKGSDTRLYKKNNNQTNREPSLRILNIRKLRPRTGSENHTLKNVDINSFYDVVVVDPNAANDIEEYEE